MEETNLVKLIDKAIFGMVSASSGRNASELLSRAFRVFERDVGVRPTFRRIGFQFSGPGGDSFLISEMDSVVPQIHSQQLKRFYGNWREIVVEGLDYVVVFIH